MLNLKKYKNALLVIVGASFCLAPLHSMKNDNMDIDVYEKTKEKSKNRIQTFLGHTKKYSFHTRTEKFLFKKKNQHKRAFLIDSREPVEEKIAHFLKKRINSFEYINNIDHLQKIEKQLTDLVTFLAKKIFKQNETKIKAYNKALTSITNDKNNTYQLSSLGYSQKSMVIGDIMKLLNEALTKVKKWYCLE